MPLWCCCSCLNVFAILGCVKCFYVCSIVLAAMMNKRLVLTLVLINYLPSLFFVVLQASSLAFGLVVAAVLSVVINYKNTYLREMPRRATLVAAVVVVGLILQSLYLYVAADSQKPLTVVFLPILLVGVYFFGRRFVEQTPEELDATVFAFLLLTIVLGWLGYFGVSKIGGYVSYAKAVAPFSEESHFALSLGLFAVAYSGICSFQKYVFIFLNLAALSILFPSLTLLTFVVLVFVVGFARAFPGYFFISGGVIATVLFIVVSAVVGQVEYFSDRLTFEDTDNMTTLVWLQGWDLAVNNFISTYGVGLGFQMLGQDGTQLSDISYRTKDIAGGFKNLDDGGFVAAKVVAELGVIGLALSVLYVLFVGWFLIYLADKNRVLAFRRSRREHSSLKVMYLGTLVFGFVVEFFFRGYGYFSPGVFFVIAALVSLKYEKRNVRG